MNLRIPAAVTVALAAGVIMSFGQTFAPAGIAPIFNSAAPVVALAAGVAFAARSWWGHVVLAAAAGPLAMVGYYGTSALRGYGVSSSMVMMWCTTGVIAGAVVGLAVWALRGHGDQLRHIGPMRALGAAAFPAVALGEAAHGITRISDTTPVAYWWSLGQWGWGCSRGFAPRGYVPERWLRSRWRRQRLVARRCGGSTTP